MMLTNKVICSKVLENFDFFGVKKIIVSREDNCIITYMNELFEKPTGRKISEN